MLTDPILLAPETGIPFHTAQIQEALDRCRDAGGGEVVLSAGEWRTASLRLYSRTTLRLLSGARLLASADWRDYTDWKVPSTLGYLQSPYVREIWNLPGHYLNSPITAFEAEDVAVIGEEGSLIDGADCFDPNGEEKFRGPMGMVFCKCRNVTLRGYTYQNAANWCHQLDSCQNVHMENVTVLAGHDGVNIHHCTGVRIENCDFRTGDDCIAGYDAENVVVRGCSLNTSCNSLRIGANGLLVERCRFWGPGAYPHRVSGRHNTLCAFEYYAMTYDSCRRDSGDWRIQDCTFEGLDSLFHYNYGGDWMHSGRPLRDVSFRRITVTGLSAPSLLKTLPEAPLHVALEDASFGWRDGIPSEGVLRCSENVSFSLRNVRAEGLF